MSKELREANGLRTEVKYGHITAKDALDKVKAEGYTSEKLIGWLQRRIARESK